MDLPEEVIKRVKDALRRKPPPGRFPPPRFFDDSHRQAQNHAVDNVGDLPKNGHIERTPPMHAEADYKRPHLMMRTRQPTRYWTGIRIPVPPAPAMLLAVSHSVTGHGFFFDALPWMIVAAAIMREDSPAVKITTKINPEIRVVASADLLTRALANLIRNAVKYAGDAGPIDVPAKKKLDIVEIEVRDKGSGVPADLLDQLFEPFFRPEESRDRDSGGVGLGMAIVKTCVETCNGTVSACNRKPTGFAVTITLNT
jgi:hypothetical protein